MRLNICALLGCAVLLTAPWQLTTRAQMAGGSNDVAVMVNAANPLGELSVAELRRILLGERRFWRGSVQVKLLLPQPGTHERDRVVTVLLGLSSMEFGKHWKDKVFRGEAPNEPASLPSAIASRYIQENPGALAFVVFKNMSSEVKILKLDGKLPGQPGYVLTCTSCQRQTVGSAQ